MANLSSDRTDMNRKDSEIIDYDVKGSTTIYKGALVCDLDTGYASPGADGSGNVFLGVAMEKADNSSGSDGDETVRVYKTGSFKMSKSSAVQTDIGQTMYIQDDQTVGTSSSNSISAGYCVGVPDSSNVRVRIDTAVQ